jgi:hypothetical protein
MSEPTFETWKSELEKLMLERWKLIPSGTDFDSFEGFYNDGYSPLDALLEEESCF